MRDLSFHNPTQRKLPSIAKSSFAVRGVAPTLRADSDVATFIWGIFFFLVLFLGLVGGPLHAVLGGCAVPFVAAIHVVFSKMGGSLVWAWTLAGIYCCLGTLWVIAVGV